MKTNTKAALAAIMIMSLIAVALPAATASYPTTFGTGVNANSYPAMPSTWSTGSVTGRVTTQNTTVGLGGAYVSIVNASNNSQEYFNVTADAMGYYQMTGVNATVNGGVVSPAVTASGPASGEAYMMYANLSPFGEGYSHAFSVQSSATSTTSVVIFTKAAKITVTAERNYVVSDSADNIQITAYVYDALGNKVGDGTPVFFSIDNMTNQASWGGVKPTGDMSAGTTNYYNGSFYGYNSTTGGNNIGGLTQRTGITSGNVSTKDGAATIQYGWVPDIRGGNNTTIWAYYAADPSINGSVKIYFRAPTASWTGYVVDSYGTGYGGITVTLHVRNASNGEIYNMTAPTSSSQPFVGLYVFDNIVLTPDTAWAFADASAQLTDNMTIYGRSNNYSLNKSSTSSGFIVLHVPPPDAIYVTADPSTILVGGDTSIITAQLYLNGQPYHRSNIKIQFSSDNDTVATLPAVKTNVSDLNGQATIPLTSNKTIGMVNITANSSIMYGEVISNSTVVYVVGWGTVSGIITDQNKVGIPYANVTLWYAVQNGTVAEQYDNNGIVKIPENPQQSNDGRTAAVGMYTYYRVPWGLYNVTAEKQGHVYYAVFVLGPNTATSIAGAKNFNGEIGTATHNIAIPDYAYMAPSTPTPTVTPTPTTQASATATTTVTATPTPGFEALFALAGLLGVAYLIARKEN